MSDHGNLFDAGTLLNEADEKREIDCSIGRPVHLPEFSVVSRVLIVFLRVFGTSVILYPDIEASLSKVIDHGSFSSQLIKPSLS